MRANLEIARAYADRVAAGDDPYRTATGMIVKAYRAEWDGTLQPYALYVPRDYKPGRPGGWPLVVALHGAYSDHRHNLRRVFGLDNRPRENDAEASRNELPLPDVPALVVSPFGRGELMGYDGLGGDDVMRVIADVRRAYDVDRGPHLAHRSVDGGRRHLADRAPAPGAVRGAGAGVRGRRLPPDDPGRGRRALRPDALDRAIAGRARRQRRAHAGVHLSRRQGHDRAGRRFAQDGRALPRARLLGKNVRYTEYPDVAHNAWIPAYKDAALLRTLAAIKRDPAAPEGRRCRRRPACTAVPGLFGKSVPRQQPHIYVYGTHGAPDAVAAGRALATALADWGPMVGARFAVKARRRRHRRRPRAISRSCWWGPRPLNALAASRWRRPMVTPLGRSGLSRDSEPPRRPSRGKFRCTLSSAR